MDGDVTVRVDYSTLNYKDGLAITGKAPVVRRFPMIAASILPAPWKLPAIPSGRPATRSSSTAGAAARPISAVMPARRASKGTAGAAAGLDERARGHGHRHRRYTAMLAVMALERHGLKPEQGPIVITGAAVGVGSVASPSSPNAASRSMPSPAARPRRTTSRAWAPPRSSSARSLQDPQAARQGALGGRRGRGRLGHPRQPALHDPLWRAVAACGLAGAWTCRPR